MRDSYGSSVVSALTIKGELERLPKVRYTIVNRVDAMGGSLSQEPSMLMPSPSHLGARHWCKSDFVQHPAPFGPTHPKLGAPPTALGADSA